MGYNSPPIQRWDYQPTFDFQASQVMWCVNMDEGHTVCHHIPPAFSRVRQGTRPLWQETTAQICSVTISPPFSHSSAKSEIVVKTSRKKLFSPSLYVIIAIISRYTLKSYHGPWRKYKDTLYSNFVRPTFFREEACTLFGKYLGWR